MPVLTEWQPATGFVIPQGCGGDWYEQAKARCASSDCDCAEPSPLCYGSMLLNLLENVETGSPFGPKDYVKCDDLNAICFGQNRGFAMERRKPSDHRPGLAFVKVKAVAGWDMIQVLRKVRAGSRWRISGSAGVGDVPLTKQPGYWYLETAFLCDEPGIMEAAAFWHQTKEDYDNA